MSDRARVFEQIYRGDVWRGGTETPSGVGSMKRSTRTLRRDLVLLLQELGITSIIDAGCGDANWMPTLPGISYRGIDILPEVIALAEQNHPDWTFGVADIVVDSLPIADAVLARDVFQHLDRPDVLAALANCRLSATWLVATSYPGRGENGLLGVTGGYTRWDLSALPFGLGPPAMSYPYTGWWMTEDGKYVKVERPLLGAWML